MRILTIPDEDARECHVLRADRALKSRAGFESLHRAVREHGVPEHLNRDNGPEFIANIAQGWLSARAGGRTLYIEPGVRGRTAWWKASTAGSGRAPLSLHRGWTNQHRTTTINRRLRLSYQVWDRNLLLKENDAI